MAVNFSIHILTHNRKDALAECIEALYTSLENKKERILVVDNASTDGTVEMLSSDYPDVEILSLDKNYGVAGGRNRGVRQLPTDWIIFIDDDCIVAENFLENFTSKINNSPEADIFTFKIKQAGSGETTCWSYYPEREKFADITFKAHIFSGGGCAIKQEVFSNIGMLDETFLFCAEELDFSLRAIDAGFSIKYTPDLCITHLGLARSPIPAERDLMHIHNICFHFFRLLPFPFSYLEVFSGLCSSVRVILFFGILKSFQVVYYAWKFARNNKTKKLSYNVIKEINKLKVNRPSFWQRICKAFKQL